MERGDGVRGGEGLQRERLRGGVFHRRDVLRLRRFQLGERGRLPDVQPLEDHVELDKPREPSTACISGAGVGACARSGTTVCSGTSIVCGATPGAASSYQTSAAPNGSWDWNCDGKVEMEYAACTLAFCNGAAAGASCGFAEADLCVSSGSVAACGATFTGSPVFGVCCSGADQSYGCTTGDPGFQCVEVNAPTTQGCE